MRRRFLIRSSLSDLPSLGAAIVVSSLYVFGTVLPWNSTGGRRDIPMVLYMTLSLILFSFLTAQMSGPGVRAHLWADVRHIPGHRWADRIAPAVQPAVLLEIVPARHRRFVAGSGYGSSHREAPSAWTERIAVITGEKQLAEDLIDSPHAEIVWVLEPKSETVPDLPDRDVTMAVDLRVVLSERGPVCLVLRRGRLHDPTLHLDVRGTHGRVPLGASGGGMGDLGATARSRAVAPGQASDRDAGDCDHSPLWVTLSLVVAAYLRLTSPGPVLFRQERVGLGGAPFVMYKFRTMGHDAEKDGP